MSLGTRAKYAFYSTAAICLPLAPFGIQAHTPEAQVHVLKALPVRLDREGIEDRKSVV